MSSTESSGDSAESTATSQPTGETAPAPAFGSTRGSGLARGKRPSNSPAASAAAAPSGYKPTAIEILNAPREYQNPFAPVESAPAAPAVSEVPTSIEAPVAAPAPIVASAEFPAPAAPAPASARVYVKPATDMFPLDNAPAPAPAETDEPAELNILPPERAKSVPAQTWESEGFKAPREPRTERPRREERSEPSAPVDLSSIPEKFLYVRPGYNFVPTPSNYGGAPRENRAAAGQPASAPAAARPAATPAAPAAGGGFFGWVKSLFGGGDAAPTVTETPAGERAYDRQRGGRDRSDRPQGSGGDRGGQRRHRGGRGRGPRGGGGDRAGSSGSSQGGGY